MRDLSMHEIEMVSGAGWTDWFGSVGETVMQWMQQIQQFFNQNDIPKPTQQQLDLVQSNCTYGIQGMTLTNGGGSASLGISTVNGFTITLTQTGGTFSFTCQPNP